MNWIKENWFKLSLLIVVAWFLRVLQGGIGIEIKHEGWIESEAPPRTGFLR